MDNQDTKRINLSNDNISIDKQSTVEYDNINISEDNSEKLDYTDIMKDLNFDDIDLDESLKTEILQEYIDNNKNHDKYEQDSQVDIKDFEENNELKGETDILNNELYYELDDDKYEQVIFDDINNLTIEDFEEIDNINNLSYLEMESTKKEPVLSQETKVIEPNDIASIDEKAKAHLYSDISKETPAKQLSKKGYIRKQSPPPKPETLKRKSSYQAKTEHDKSKSHFYYYVLVASVLICALIFLLVFTSVFKNNHTANTNNNNNNSNISVPNTDDIDSSDDIDNSDDLLIDDTTQISDVSIGIIEDISKSGSVQIYDFESQSRVNLKCVQNTNLTDEYGKALVLGEFAVGDIVQYTTTDSETTLAELSLSDDGFDAKRITGVINNPDEKTFMYNDKLYNYNDSTIVEFDRGTYTPENISDCDLLDIRGYNDTIYYIDVIKGHGTVKFTPNTNIINGIAEIDTTQSYNTDELTTLTLSEGSHKIVVKGDNIDPYISDILVEANKTTDVNLNLAQIKQGLLIPTLTPSNCKLEVDGETIDTSSPILLDYGPHTITVSANGYDSYQDTINIASQETRIKVLLEQKIVTGNLNITTDPDGASIYIDNEYIGTSPIKEPIEYGDHTIIVKMDGYIEITYPVEVDKDNNSLFFPLQKSPETIADNSADSSKDSENTENIADNSNN